MGYQALRSRVSPVRAVQPLLCQPKYPVSNLACFGENYWETRKNAPRSDSRSLRIRPLCRVVSSSVKQQDRKSMDESKLFSLMVDLHRDGKRQGPGSTQDTLRALELSGIDHASRLRVADIGCGTGASTLVLADALKNAHITAVDLYPEFLDVLAQNSEDAGLSDAIEVVEESMDSLRFADESLDLIWSEGAIYNIGFASGIEGWRRFLKPGGVLAVSEITWLRPDPPIDLKRHWESEYREIGTAAEKVGVLEHSGYDLFGYFVLPASSWIENYYKPTDARIAAFLERHAGEQEADELVEMEREEAELYLQYQDFFSYGFYIARKRWCL